MKYTPVLGIALILAFLSLGTVVNADSKWDRFKDPADGQFDLSMYLTGRTGFVPIPIIITEPAVGYGGGLVISYFHPTRTDTTKLISWEEIRQGEQKGLEPPTISGVLGFGTENGTWGAGIFHSHTWKGDWARYLGALMRASINLKFYGFPGGRGILDRPLEYTIKSWYLFQRFEKRLGQTDFFLGAKYRYSDQTVIFDLGNIIPDVDPLELDSSSAGFGVLAAYENLDNAMDSNNGVRVAVGWMDYGEIWGGDFEYNELEVSAFGFINPHPRVVLGLDVEGDFVGGDVPFYDMPYISLRGVPVMRYQGKIAISTEAEVRWRFSNRWSAIGFGGYGWAMMSFDESENATEVGSGGFGFRYMVARMFGLNAGLDFAWSKDDFAWYIQFGNAWH